MAKYIWTRRVGDIVTLHIKVPHGEDPPVEVAPYPDVDSETATMLPDDTEQGISYNISIPFTELEKLVANRYREALQDMLDVMDRDEIIDLYLKLAK